MLAEEAEAEAARLAREEARRREGERQAELAKRYETLKGKLLDKVDVAERAADALATFFGEIEALAGELRTCQAERGTRAVYFSEQSVRRRLSQYLSLALSRCINPTAVRFGDISLATVFNLPVKAMSWRERENTTYNGTRWTGHD